MKLVVGIIFCLLLSVAVFSQQASLIEEFGTLSCDEYLMRMDVSLLQASKDSSAKITVLIYEGKEPRYNVRKNTFDLALPAFGSAKAKFKSMETYISMRKFPIDRVSFVNAGFRENFGVEIWLVPSGALPPEPTPTLKKIKYRRGKANGFCLHCCG